MREASGWCNSFCVLIVSNYVDRLCILKLLYRSAFARRKNLTLVSQSRAFDISVRRFTEQDVPGSLIQDGLFVHAGCLKAKCYGLLQLVNALERFNLELLLG